MRGRPTLSWPSWYADTRGVVTATLIEPGQVVASGQTAIRGRALRRKGSRGRDSRDAGRPRQRRLGERDPVVRVEPEIRREATRDRARGRSGHAYLSCEILAPGADDKVSLGMTATLTLSDPATQRVARLPSGWCRRCRSEVENRILSLRGATHEAIQ